MLDDTCDDNIVIIDKMTYAANEQNLEDIKGRYDLCHGDIADPHMVDEVFKRYRPSRVVNFAAETHVDRSIASSSEFVTTNFVGVQVLLDACLRYNTKRFLQVSTDEVYGDVADKWFASKEGDVLAPSSPYSAAKAAADLLALSYVRTHKMDVVITRCTNNYGTNQYPEKFIPLAITKLLKGEKIPVYGTGENVRDWIYVTDHCRGILDALNEGRAGEIYNFSGGTLLSNIAVVKKLLKLFGKDESYIEFVKDRKGHDVKYWLNSNKAKDELGWIPAVDFDTGLIETVEWYKK
jgi:dTDP-glucose 4,6-dehydratase